MLFRSQQQLEQPDAAHAAPLLVLPGTLYDRRVFAEVLARLVLIEGAGHHVTLGRPQAVADEIAARLATPSNNTH